MNKSDKASNQLLLMCRKVAGSTYIYPGQVEDDAFVTKHISNEV